MRRYFKKVVEVYKKDGVKSLLIRSSKNLYNLLKIYVYNDRNNLNNWVEIKNKYKGKRVFIIGNGPSLNETPLYYLKDEYTLCVNRFNLMQERLNWNPTFYLVDDDLVLSDMINEIKSMTIRSKHVFLPGVHLNGKIFKNKINNKKINWFFHTFGAFSQNMPYVSTGGTVIYSGLQILYHMGFSEIVMIGVDMNYKTHDTARTLKGINIVSQADDDPNHFDPRYFGKNRKYHQPEDKVIQHIVQNLNNLSNNLTELNVRIINSGYNSKLECFKKVNYELLFKLTDKQKKELFEECLSNNSEYQRVEEFKSINSFVNSVDSSIRSFDFYCNTKNAIKLIRGENTIVYTHIPLGPFEDNYYFIKRVKNES